MKYVSAKELTRKTLLKDGDYKSVKDMLYRVSKTYPDYKIFGYLNEEKNIVYQTAKEVYEEVNDLGDGLIGLGLKDAHIVIIADNSNRYVIADMSISNGVGVVTPIDKDAPLELLITLLNKCDANAVICSSYLLDQVNSAKEKCPLLKTIITIDKKVSGVLYYDEVLGSGKALRKNGRGVYENILLNMKAPAKILFTSGTTGANKPVILSNENLLVNMMNCLEAVHVQKGVPDVSMSVLPMHHATEINTHVLARIANAKLTYINTSMKDLMVNLKRFKPTVITIVPMIANAFYKAIWVNAKKAGKDEKLKKGIKLCKLLNKFGIDITHKIFKEVYEPFGGNLREIVVGGAALNPEVVKGFKDLGIYILNGYGITECGPLISINSECYKDYKSVGKPVSSLTAKILNPDENEIGELCVKGGSVSLGYYNDKAATDKAFIDGGFFNTGDLAQIIDGKIYLTGRKKNTIVLSNGKNVYPEEIEVEIENSIPYAKQVVVYEYEKTTLSKEKVSILCAGIFCDEDIDREKLKADIIKVNEKLPPYKQINYINISNKEYDVTSTKKIKRDTVLSFHNEFGINI